MPTQDIDTATTNGHKSADSEMTAEEAKALHGKLNRFYQKQRKAKSKEKRVSVVSPLNDAVVVKREILIAKTATEWETIPIGGAFSRDPQGHVLYVRNGKSVTKNLVTGKPESFQGGAVYRVWF